MKNDVDKIFGTVDYRTQKKDEKTLSYLVEQKQQTTAKIEEFVRDKYVDVIDKNTGSLGKKKKGKQGDPTTKKNEYNPHVYINENG